MFSILLLYDVLDWEYNLKMGIERTFGVMACYPCWDSSRVLSEQYYPG